LDNKLLRLKIPGTIGAVELGGSVGLIEPPIPKEAGINIPELRDLDRVA
jgi:hypothetical protein